MTKSRPGGLVLGFERDWEGWQMKRVVLGAAAAVALATLLVASAGAQATDERFRITLKTRSFLPPQAADVAGIRSAREGAGDRVHFLAQFSAIPNAARRSAIAAQGVRLVAYVAANTYVASSSVSTLGR